MKPKNGICMYVGDAGWGGTDRQRATKKHILLSDIKILFTFA